MSKAFSQIQDAQFFGNKQSASLLTEKYQAAIQAFPNQDLLAMEEGRYKVPQANGSNEFWGLEEVWARKELLNKPYDKLNLGGSVFQNERAIYSDLTTGTAVHRFTNMPYGNPGDELYYFGKGNWSADGSKIIFVRSSNASMWGPGAQQTTSNFGLATLDANGTNLQISFRDRSFVSSPVASPTDPTKAYAISGQELLELNLKTLSVQRVVATGLQVWWLKVSPDGKYASSAINRDGGQGTVWVVDLQSGQKFQFNLRAYIHDSYRFVPGNTDWIMYWYEDEFFSSGFRVKNFRTQEEKTFNHKFDWNHGDVGTELGVHSVGAIYQYQKSANNWTYQGNWMWPKQVSTGNGPFYNAVLPHNGYLAHVPESDLWAYPTTIYDRPNLSEISAVFARGSDTVGRANRFRLFVTNVSLTKDRLGAESRALDRPNASPDGTKILFNSNAIGSSEVFMGVAKKPLAPTEVSVVWNASSPLLKWKAAKVNKEIRSYQIFRTSSSGKDFEWIAEVPSSQLSYTDTSALPGKVYYYAIKSQEHSKLESELSNEVFISSDPALSTGAHHTILVEAEWSLPADPTSPSPDALWMGIEGMASNLRYVWQRRSDKVGNVSLPITLAKSGTYYVTARLKGESGSVFKFHGQELRTGSSKKWSWVKAASGINLSSGQSQLILESSLYGSQIDCLILSTDSNFSPVNRIKPYSITPPQLRGALESNSPRLSWSQQTLGRFSHYNIYVGPNADFIPSQGNLVASPDGLSYLDWQSRTAARFYKVTSVSLDGFESPASNSINPFNNPNADVLAPNAPASLRLSE